MNKKILWLLVLPFVVLVPSQVLSQEESAEEAPVFAADNDNYDKDFSDCYSTSDEKVKDLPEDARQEQWQILFDECMSMKGYEVEDKSGFTEEIYRDESIKSGESD